MASSPSPSQVLDRAPTQITVQFSEPVNIQQLAYQAFEVTLQRMLPQVFVEGDDGTIYYARFLTYDRTTNTATFQMLDGLPNGSYTLHLSGPGGLTDLGGNPLPGNDPSGDYVIPFTVAGARPWPLGRHDRRLHASPRRSARGPRTSGCCSPTSCRPG